MKNWFTTIIALTFCSFANNVRAENTMKIYMPSEKIMIMPNGIFFMNEVGDVCPASMVSCDEGGIFVVSEGECFVCGPKYRHAPWCPYSDLPRKG